jgi:hypothetical protein
MKYFFILIFSLLLSAGCKEKKATEAELEKKLMQTMNDYLNKNSKGKTLFTVKEVLFDPRKGYYYCEFRVNMHDDTKDTTGTMTALISNDFADIQRSQ